jgi:uncharacterized phage infection (PIP) family protein YhgE
MVMVILFIENEYADGSVFSEGFAVIKSQEKDGYISKKGDVVIQPEFDEASLFNEGMARIKKNNKIWVYK